MKRGLDIFLALTILFSLFSCKATLPTNKMDGYNKKITDNLTVFITISDGKARTEWGEKLKERLEADFSEKGIDADITIIQSDINILNASINNVFKTENANGLIFMISEENTLSSVGYETGDFALSLEDTTLGKVVWKSKMTLVFKGGLGTKNRVNSSAKAIMEALEKDNLF
ncbi:MAG: hypothetical protein ACLVKO_06830 [Dysgonomonas sp.]